MIPLLFKWLLGLLAALALCLTAAIYLAPEATLGALQRAMRWRSGLERAEISVDGLRTVYLTGGQGEPLLLLHGFGGEKDSFTRVARRLAPTYQLVIPDVIGFGESDKPADLSYALDDVVERLHALIQALQLENVSLAGNSMGGLIAGAYAAKHPGEVKTLWLIAPGGVLSAPKSELAQYLDAHGLTLAPKTVEDFERLMQYVVSKPPRLPRPFIRVMAARTLANQALQDRIFQQMTPPPGFEERLPGLRTPTLISWGDADRIINPAAAQILHRLLPNSTVRMMPGLGHLPMLEDDEAAARDYLAFRAALAPAP